MQSATGASSLADILERVLDRGIVIAGDITVSLVEIELLTIKVRLVIASVDRAREIGINWWENDPALSTGARPMDQMEAENRDLRERIERLEQQAGAMEAGAGPLGALPPADAGGEPVGGFVPGFVPGPVAGSVSELGAPAFDAAPEDSIPDMTRPQAARPEGVRPQEVRPEEDTSA
ncbi:gas vesicle protein GvpA/GvpJ/GvpM family [Eilatimonas milleporae]|uniref:Gas vesicle protein GvpA/GvpJ/GvpM family n=1 Tax=Eilatimonas milleporae TaxID=911205 RepID=A0A3M0CTJ5_9PROT|nr:gas vesicle protein [Eilatimonas milleporae]RMB12377.1 gas vesicle protein GvpA/GvpJ/GvpM family [Eilatimonas milleporae]